MVVGPSGGYTFPANFKDPREGLVLEIADRVRWLGSPRQLLLGLLIGIALACASGAWFYGQHRYGQLLNEWRWRRQVGGVRTAVLDPTRSDPASSLLFS
jgi:hypothetical protein